MIKAVGFDLGETLIHNGGIPLSWRSLYRPALVGVAESCGLAPGEDGIKAAERILARYNTRINPRTRETSSDVIFKEIFEEWKCPIVDSPLGKATESFFSFFRQKQQLYADVIPTLDKLRTAGIPMGVLTDVPYGMPNRLLEIDVSPIAPYMDVVLSSVDVGWRKPETYGFKMLAEALQFKPGEMIYIGNEQKDIDGAKYAGMIAVLIDREGTSKNTGADMVITSLSELRI